jgi:hypothetical protein
MASTKPAFLYVIGPERGPHKIGLSVAPKKRLISLQSGNPDRLILKRATPAAVGDAALVESYRIGSCERARS